MANAQWHCLYVCMYVHAFVYVLVALTCVHSRMHKCISTSFVTCYVKERRKMRETDGSDTKNWRDNDEREMREMGRERYETER